MKKAVTMVMAMVTVMGMGNDSSIFNFSLMCAIITTQVLNDRKVG